MIEILRWSVILLAVLLLVMYVYGIRLYVVTTGSMMPAIPVGSICFVNHNIPYGSIIEGDVISFRIGENTLVTHRVLKIEPDGITTKGDANNTEDASKVTTENYIGKTIFHIQKIGYAMQFLKSRKGRVIVCAIIFLLLGSIFFADKNKNTAS